MHVAATDENLAKAAAFRSQLMFEERFSPGATAYGTDEIDISVYRRAITEAKKRAVKKGLEFALASADADRFKKRCRNRCELTSVPFSTAKIPGHHKAPYMPSLDRIDSDDGYTFENCRVLCVAANLALNEWGEHVFRRIANGYLFQGDKSHF